jgi:hypothetical protein
MFCAVAEATPPLALPSASSHSNVRHTAIRQDQPTAPAHATGHLHAMRLSAGPLQRRLATLTTLMPATRFDRKLLSAATLAAIDGRCRYAIAAAATAIARPRYGEHRCEALACEALRSMCANSCAPLPWRLHCRRACARVAHVPLVWPLPTARCAALAAACAPRGQSSRCRTVAAYSWQMMRHGARGG